MYQYPDYLMHYGVKGMKWGVRRAEKRRSKYANKAIQKAKRHQANSKWYSETAKRYRRMSDTDYASMFDDDELLKLSGGAHTARLSEIKANELRASDSASAAKQWLAVHDEIMNTPIDKLKKKMDYKEIINRHLNDDL